MAEKETSHKADRGKLSPELNWPKFQWNVTKWLTIASFLIGALLLIFPGWSEGKFDEYRILVAVLIIMSPFLLFTAFPWICKVSTVTARRLRCYPKLLETSKGQGRDLKAMNKMIVDFIQNHINSNSFEIVRSAFTNEKLYILLARQSGKEMVVGNIVEVLHKKDNMLMGRFKVTELREKVYYAEGISHVDPLWLGYVRKQGEIQIQPHMIAIHVPNGGQNGK